MKKQTVVVVSVVVALCSLGGASSWAGSHLWDINEVFSNLDGTIQFIELHCPPGADAEISVNGSNFTSLATGGDFTISGLNLTVPTGRKYILFATAGFAELAGAPTPDFIIPAGMVPFVGVDVDETLKYNPIANYDTLTFTAGQLPTDGVHSMSRNLTARLNSPTNFAGETGSVNASGDPVPSVTSWGLTATVLLVMLAGTILLRRRRGRTANRPI